MALCQEQPVCPWAESELTLSSELRRIAGRRTSSSRWLLCRVSITSYSAGRLAQVHDIHTHKLFEDEDARAKWCDNHPGNYKRSMECASASSALAKSLVIAKEKKRIYEVK